MTVVPAVAIVGLGPRGLYCLEALVAEFRARPLAAGLEVAIFNKSSQFGVSPIYDPHQPPFLLSNIRAKELDLWDPDGFTHWYNARYRPSAPVDPETYPPRAVVGRYLLHGFERVMSRVPPGLRVVKYAAEVTDIVAVGSGYCLTFVDRNGWRDEFLAHKIVLTTGHSFARPTRHERRYHSLSDRHPATSFIPHAYPVMANLGGVPAGSRVAMKGIGLTFVDAVLALTEGRDGSFKRAADGRLRYLATGREPKTIIPFSLTGLPMVPKPRDFPSSLRALTFLTAARLGELRRRAGEGKLDLKKEIWPLAELEMELRYYRTAMDDPRDLRTIEECGDDANAVRWAIRDLLRSHPDLEPFGYGRVIDPVGGRRFAAGEEYHSFVERYLQREIAHAHAGLASSPVRSAVSMWFEIRAALKPIVAFGGLTPQSHRLLIEHYFPLFKRVVFGPPIISMEKILALHRGGILDFSVARNPRVIVRHSIGCFELRTSWPAGASARAEVLVDARYPTMEIRRDVSPLYRRLYRRGMVREFTNTSAGTAYATGAIDMSRDSHQVIGRHGEVSADVTVYGPPTEGNLIGNFVISRDDYATSWAASVVRQLRTGAGTV